ncbi:hypothetical protein [Haladaptatus sp. CMAA 1911]|uniref:hypothetical protein n=1 Tax=unclassified Haladaptatus TaxID=2622732 RepID=UPI003753EB1E
MEARVDEPPNWNDVMDVGIPAEFLTSHPTGETPMVVAFEGFPADFVPSRSICWITTTLPIRMI